MKKHLFFFVLPVDFVGRRGGGWRDRGSSCRGFFGGQEIPDMERDESSEEGLYFFSACTMG